MHDEYKMADTSSDLNPSNFPPGSRRACRNKTMKRRGAARRQATVGFWEARHLRIPEGTGSIPRGAAWVMFGLRGSESALSSRSFDRTRQTKASGDRTNRTPTLSTPQCELRPPGGSFILLDESRFRNTVHRRLDNNNQFNSLKPSLWTHRMYRVINGVKFFRAWGSLELDAPLSV